MRYVAPLSVEEAANVLGSSAGRARLMAGGTDLLPRFSSGSGYPDVLVDIKRIPELMQIGTHADGSATIGAAVCGADIYEHAELRRYWPGVTEATDLIGSVQIQSRASLGGNLCNASPAADSVPALIAARAQCLLVGSTGMRQLPVEQIIVSPGKTCLRADEIMLSITLPSRPPRSADAYLRLTPRAEMDIAVVGAGANLVLDEEGAVVQCHVALGAVAPVPVLASEAAALLLGSRLEDDVIKRFSHRIKAACHPIDDKRGTADYRTDMAAVLAVRAVRTARQRALSGER
ncbi:FAD binding domain-containing protein [Pseudohongiella spirulinae]|uniref:Oxidoreductase n=1 Tax=Pseudohongiella spirulinae TaxID=1249552 RepID=A0A0S2KG41_9GAMM|nr:xanthine dehydrogenase family protein subunit M [Pseudohongiella spirulinae]ALO47242.1 oxidoreductase [Pseudohongiella spirulinae]